MLDVDDVPILNHVVFGLLTHQAGGAFARFLPLGTNTGFTGGITAGMARSKARNVVFLNNDAILTEDYVGMLVEDLRADRARGSACGKLLRPADGAAIATIDSAIIASSPGCQRREGATDGERRNRLAADSYSNSLLAPGWSLRRLRRLPTSPMPRRAAWSPRLNSGSALSIPTAAPPS